MLIRSFAPVLTLSKKIYKYLIIIVYSVFQIRILNFFTVWSILLSMERSINLKPQDVAILMKLFSLSGEGWRQMDIAAELGLSQGEIAKALSRLAKAGLVNQKTPSRAAALEFVVHAVKYMFPAQLGPLSYGVPTAISAPAHSKMVVNSEDVYVWPSPKGQQRGQSIKPLYPKLAEAALKDKKFYNLMSAIEILRMGRARERKQAEAYLQKNLVPA